MYVYGFYSDAGEKQTVLVSEKRYLLMVGQLLTLNVVTIPSRNLSAYFSGVQIDKYYRYRLKLACYPFKLFEPFLLNKCEQCVPACAANVSLLTLPSTFSGGGLAHFLTSANFNFQVLEMDALYLHRCGVTCTRRRVGWGGGGARLVVPRQPTASREEERKMGEIEFHGRMLQQVWLTARMWKEQGTIQGSRYRIERVLIEANHRRRGGPTLSEDRCTIWFGCPLLSCVLGRTPPQKNILSCLFKYVLYV